VLDRLLYGHTDTAHLIAPLAIAATLGRGRPPQPLTVPFVLGLNGNGITMSTALAGRIAQSGTFEDPRRLGAALASEAAERKRAGTKLRFGVVHRYSSHNYMLRYWLAASGIDPDRTVEIVVLPPPLMPDAIEMGAIDGYCVGEPWNSISVKAGTGRIATVKQLIWSNSPEKVLGVSERWAATRPEALAALLRALYRAAQWCAAPANHREAATLLGRPAYLGCPAELIERGLSGRLMAGEDDGVSVPDFYVPYDHHATLPRPVHAMWFYAQMVRWGHVQHVPRHAELARGTFAPDIYRSAIGSLAGDLPESDTGRLDGSAFFDGRDFDATDLKGYIASQRPYA